MKRTAKAVTDILSKVFGDAFIADFGDFVRDLETMTAELRLRAQNIPDALAVDREWFCRGDHPRPICFGGRGILAKRAVEAGAGFCRVRGESRPGGERLGVA